MLNWLGKQRNNTRPMQSSNRRDEQLLQRVALPINQSATKNLRRQTMAKMKYKNRKAGSSGGNQYGAYQVRYASEKQVNFIKKLFDTKQHSYEYPDFETLNVQGATELIANLLKCPNEAGVVRLATSKQLWLLGKLVENKQEGKALLSATLTKEGVTVLEQLSIDSVSALITQLKDAPIRQPEIKEVGAYLLNNSIYQIREGYNSNKLQVWTINRNHDGFDYDTKKQSVLYELKPEHRLTLSKAIELSVQFGCCVHCGRALTKASSVARGMGAVCAGKYQA